ncbi:LpqB family beta-propeller domain-containing protein [Wenjunlia tyrosinilytica]|uniref:Acyl-peptide hydrolase n=1 Tax=Wenjunlia tyrosinilytica TaxID=1544741 RepID=A0A917ZUZ0_9ACTN|nr:LpqB family beta-propeller domain-containing protein [Wenjunlia tyrosinilytica]GGO95022.1 acyl-peptide hydrolase [Wenjunlia tyrosinilytica]
MPTTASYGSWKSPVTARLAAGHDGRPDWVGAIGDEVWWTEPRPAERGRAALVRRGPDGTAESVLPPPWNVRSRVIEYGGRPWAGTVADGGPLVVFVNFADQRMYRFEPGVEGAEPRPLTPAPVRPSGLRWADLAVVPERGEVWCVLEESTGPGSGDLRRVLVAVPLDESAAHDRSAVRELGGGGRFLTGPRLSPDGRRAAWLAWDHPAMPWDGTRLCVADLLPDGTFGEPRTVGGGPEESVAQVEWADEDTLVAATDRSGWWNLHRVDPRTGQAVPLCPAEEEFAGPLWRLGLQWFAPLPDGRIAVTHGRGAQRLAFLDPSTGTLEDIAGPWTEWASCLAVTGDAVLGVAASPQRSFEVVRVETASGRAEVVGCPHEDTVEPSCLPLPQERTFTGPGGREVHAHIYPPRNPDYTAPRGERPPYAVWAHGGPTGRAALVHDLEIAYFTSRGIGVAVVNYGGSTGYGREYRNRLRESWGVVDVEDCAAVAEALAAEGTADRDRLAVRGGSAGGWTAGASLTMTDTYRCGVIIYPILDLTGWATGETHDFESRYLDSLVGPLPDTAERYRKRSPADNAHRLTAPFLLLQGLDDVICPPVQCERFLERVAGRGVPHAYLTFEGEGHGFRRAETMVACLEAELSLYGQVFGFTPPGVPVLDLVK